MSKLLVLFVFLSTMAGGQTAENVRAYFSPKGGCTEVVVKSLDAAKETILVQAYSFTSAPIAKALVDARKRGVNITVILDQSNVTGKYSAADFVSHAGITTYIDGKHAIAHNKIMIIDGGHVITGSFNFTKAAEDSNAENLVIIDDIELAKQYTTNLNTHLAHASLYTGKKVKRPKTK